MFQTIVQVSKIPGAIEAQNVASRLILMDNIQFTEKVLLGEIE